MENKTVEPAKILMSKTDMSKDDIELLSLSEQWKMIYSLSPIKSIQKSKQQEQVCFTGFGVSKKEELISLAIEKNFHIAKSVTQNLTYLVGDDNSGPAKVKKAKQVGAQFLNESEFIHLIETGEINID